VWFVILPDPVNTAIVDRGIRKDESNLHIQFMVYLVFYPRYIKILPDRITDVGLNYFRS
jgi:hypothetical protein